MFRVGQRIIYEDGSYKFEGVVLLVDEKYKVLDTRLTRCLGTSGRTLKLPIKHSDSFRCFKPFNSGQQNFLSLKPKNKPEEE